MHTVAELAEYLEQRVPAALKMDFDNVGLLCGFPDREVTRVLVALDATGEVIEEAAEWGAELIVTHHPLIFHPLKRVLATEEVGGRVTRLLQKGISVISLHTNLDIVEGGVNDALASAVGAVVTERLPCGCVGELREAESMACFLHRVQAALGVSGLRYYDGGKAVRRIVLCGGAGGELVEEVLPRGADTLLTGEIRYDQWLTGRALGLNLIDADHFCTENVVTPVLRTMVKEGFPELEVRISRALAQTALGL